MKTETEILTKIILNESDKTTFKAIIEKVKSEVDQVGFNHCRYNQKEKDFIKSLSEELE